MSETNVPYGTGPGSPGSATPDDGGTGGKHATGVKDRVGDAASHAGDAGREVAGDAKEKARDVAHEAKDRARGLVEQTRDELSTQASSQQQRLAGGLRSLGDELRQMADGTQDPGYASDLVQRAGDATGRVADWFEERDPSSVLRDVEDFARRRPGLFIAIAAGAGLVVGRLLRGAKDASDTGPDRSEGAGSTGYGTEGYGTTGATAGYGTEDYRSTGTTTGYGTGGYGTGSAYATGATTGSVGTTAGGVSGSGVAGGEPGARTTGTYGLGDDALVPDPEQPTTAEPTPPPSFPPTPTGGAAGTSTLGGEADVERT
ncbi:hypothetical protein [Cellulosimicrobium sp. Marseille-Q4280]|jgi:ElaB/YqjD/DUF883 family membrane-anchored ribosome-binding protein|uniref:hypothetical protein n=1 Tax=Cellulosimicrobium sp. Marseille-Q4280 TaxID=2937992 RepID=UPI00203C1781|nr:hypothetical protein [Cellulosimicrobium sp. Marseille-Q4280]